jgi:hypothetical protein
MASPPGSGRKGGDDGQKLKNGYILPGERLVTTGFSYVFGEAPQNVTPLLNSVLCKINGSQKLAV